MVGLVYDLPGENPFGEGGSTLNKKGITERSGFADWTQMDRSCANPENEK
jgi:hypothetical protein